MVDKDSYLKLLLSEANDAKYDSAYCDKEMAYAKEQRKLKGVKFKEKRLWKTYISYLKRRKKYDSKNLKSLNRLIFLASNIRSA